MKIAFPTNDRKTLADRTGRAKEFVIYELSSHEVINVEYHENTHEHHDHSHDDEHGHGHGHKEITDNLLDIDFLFVKQVGKHMKKDLVGNGIEFKKTDKSIIQEIINDLLKK